MRFPNPFICLIGLLIAAANPFVPTQAQETLITVTQGTIADQGPAVTPYSAVDRISLSLQYLYVYRGLFLNYLFTGNNAGISSLFENALACQFTSTLVIPLPHQPLYQLSSGNCASVDLTHAKAGNYYADNLCTVEIAYQPTRYIELCVEAAAPNGDRLGNAATWDGKSIGWTLMPSNRFDIGILPLQGNHQPFMTRVKYKEALVTRGNGVCKLEMRIYKKNIAEQNLRPILAIHGGSWKYRGLAFLALEAEISQLTERGFVVFSPFYRLTGDSTANVECNGSTWEHITKDVEDALDWVKVHAIDYGANGGPLTVVGQSAGAHLSAWLSVYRSQDIAKALLLYPPTDLRDFVREARLGNITKKSSIEAAEAFFGQPIDQIDLFGQAVSMNSFPSIVQNTPDTYPPIFMIHGNQDQTVPSRQSVRLCNALSGSIETGPVIDDGGDPSIGMYKKVYFCDHKDSQVHLIAEADHALDGCSTSLGCPAGSEASQAAVRESMLQALGWLEDTIIQP